MGLGVLFATSLQAEPDTNSLISNPGQTTLETSNAASAVAPATNAVSAVAEEPAPTPTPSQASPPPVVAAPSLIDHTTVNFPSLVLGAILILASTTGFLLYQCGLTRAKNCGHTSMVLLVGLVAGLAGYWAGGFAVQTGGIGDAHAALTESILPSATNGLDHEIGFMANGHHWGLMGSAGFFLSTQETARNGIATLFLMQAALLTITVAAALGAGLERGRLIALAIGAFLTGVIIYPLYANWVWGGGWLAELGREFGLGHGTVDLAGAGVVHLTAGTLALVLAIILGPRHGKFGRDKVARAIPGHNVPFLVLGTLVLFFSWTAANAFAFASPLADPTLVTKATNSGTAAVNVLLAGVAGVLLTVIITSTRKRSPEPAALCRGLLAGAIGVSSCSAFIDPWAAFLIGIVAGWFVHLATGLLERRQIDDPTGGAALHGAAGAWGLIATGFFANGTGGYGMNGVEGSVRGLFFGGSWHQLAAQFIGCASGFILVFVLSYALLSLVQKILGHRAELVDEVEGLDWPQTGALGYQADTDPDAK